MDDRQADGAWPEAILDQFEKWIDCNDALRAAERHLYAHLCKPDKDEQSTQQIVEPVHEMANTSLGTVTVTHCEQLRTSLLNKSRHLAEVCARHAPSSEVGALMLQAVDEVMRDGVVDPATEEQVSRLMIAE